MQDRDDSRAEALGRLHGARERRVSCSERYESARGSSDELPAFSELQAAEEQFAAREAWLKWIDRDYQPPAEQAETDEHRRARTDQRRARKLGQVRRRISEFAAQAARRGGQQRR